MSLDGYGQKDWMVTATGREIYPLHLKPEDVDIEDIAHSLSQQARYNGHCKFPYWVGQHSLIISWALERDGFDRAIQLEGLLHDSSEYITGDMTKPMKNSIRTAMREFGKEGWYKELEHSIERIIAKKFGLNFPWSRFVEEYDTRIVIDEKEALFHRTKPWNLSTQGPLLVNIEEWKWDQCKALFLHRFAELTGG